jgi:hypothetical protein
MPTFWPMGRCSRMVDMQFSFYESREGGTKHRQQATGNREQKSRDVGT